MVGLAHLDLEPEVGQCRGDDLLSAIVAVLSYFGHQNSRRPSVLAPETIDPEAPLYGEGLGLDSIDILEVALVVSQRYGFQLRSDDDENVRIFKSLASLSEHIAANRQG